MRCIRVGLRHIFYRELDLLTSYACTDLRSAQLTALLSADHLSPRHPDIVMHGHIEHLTPCTRRDTSSLIQAFSPPSSKGCSSGGNFLFLLLLVLSRSYSLYSGEHFLLYVFVISVFSVFTYIHCAHTQSRSVLLVYLGERTGSLLGFLSLSISDF